MNIPKIKMSNNEPINKTLEGVLVNAHVKNQRERMTIDEVCDSLMLTDDNKETEEKAPSKAKSFDLKKAFLPLAIGAGAVFLGAAGISTILKKNANTIVDKYCEQLPAIAHNMNIPEETHLVIYEALRNPNPRNMLAASMVFLFSGLTIAAKNFVDGVKEIWLKKREADIERDLQENLISVETSVFSGKLKAVNKMMKDSANHFKKVFNEQPSTNTFKGVKKEKNDEQNDKKVSKKQNIKFFVLAAGVAAICILLGKLTFSNIRKANTQMEKYAKDIVDEGLKKGKIFSDASNGLSGDAGLICYYSYLNEPRGHLYNWILNPENKFLRNIFTSFTAASAVGYLFKEGMDAVKSTTVARENSKTKLDLQKRLVEVEINNFRAKKNSAIKPLMDEFNKRIQSGEKTQDELRDFAENILTEIKNGPPYVYS